MSVHDTSIFKESIHLQESCRRDHGLPKEMRKTDKPTKTILLRKAAESKQLTVSAWVFKIVIIF